MVKVENGNLVKGQGRSYLFSGSCRTQFNLLDDSLKVRWHMILSLNFVFRTTSTLMQINMKTHYYCY